MAKKKKAPAAEDAPATKVPCLEPIWILLLTDVPKLAPRGHVRRIDPQQIEVLGLYEGEDFRFATEQDLDRARS